ncbi:MAG: NYN domain-containing protein [Nanoarchaeota archaeon]|nr:NYN domain-containing protein [Nanoarchaeota archaeon]
MNSSGKKRAIVFVDGNNWYHNVKSIVKKPKSVDFGRLANLIAKHFDMEVLEIRYYNSTPDIGLGEDNYYKHMVFLAGLKKKGIYVNTNKLKKIKTNGKIIRLEKGIDVTIAVDMIKMALIEKKCESCILISGDSDFLPVMRLIKEAGREVLTASVIRGYARELLQGEFRFWILKKSDINGLIGKS